jgi:hypothetical protein
MTTAYDRFYLSSAGAATFQSGGGEQRLHLRGHVVLSQPGA